MNSSSQGIPIRRVQLNHMSDLPDDYGQTPGGTFFSTTPGGTRIIYDRKFLLKCRASPMSNTPPNNLPDIPGVTTPDKGPSKEITAIKEEKEDTNSTNGDSSPMTKDEDDQFDMELWSCSYMTSFLWRHKLLTSSVATSCFFMFLLFDFLLQSIGMWRYVLSARTYLHISLYDKNYAWWKDRDNYKIPAAFEHLFPRAVEAVIQSPSFIIVSFLISIPRLLWRWESPNYLFVFFFSIRDMLSSLLLLFMHFAVFPL